MILGLMMILLAGVLNVLLLAVPMWPIQLVTWWTVDLMQKIHWIARPGAALAYLLLVVFGLMLAACIQLVVWGLAPGVEPARWTLAVAAFGVGEACILMYGYKGARSQFMRRFRSWTSAVRVCGFSLLCLGAYSSVAIHGLLATLPGRVLHFFVGGGS